MLISHSHRFIFIHVYKVGGTSINQALGKYASFSAQTKNPIKLIKIKCGITPRVFSHDFPGHITAHNFRSMIPNSIFDQYFKFAFVRNPWDWQVSLYEYAKQSPSHQEHGLTNAFNSFDEYIEWRVGNPFTLQSDFILDPQKKILVDFVGKLENIEKDFKFVCGKININKAELPKKNQTIRKHYSEYYSEKSRNMVAEAFKRDIAMFNYTF